MGDRQNPEEEPPKVGRCVNLLSTRVFWGGVGMGWLWTKIFFPKNVCGRCCVVEMTNASIKLELFQLVVTLRDGTISKGFGGASCRCRSAFQPLKLHRGEVLAVKCQVPNPDESSRKGNKKKICCIPSVHERLNFLRSFC